MSSLTAAVDLLPEATSVPVARHVVLELLRAWQAPHDHDDVALLVTELVTNSLRHAGLGPGDELEVVVRRPPPTLRVMVIDPGVGFAPPAEPSLPPPSQATGRGLYIVSRIADRWGVSCGERTCVWFEIDGPRRMERYH